MLSTSQWIVFALAANDRYNRAAVPLLLKHGGHPVLAGRVQGRFIHAQSMEPWDQVAIARYRSRRDLLRMALDMASSGVDQHKWASLQQAHIFPVQPFFSLAWVRVFAAIVFVAIAVAIALALRA